MAILHDTIAQLPEVTIKGNFHAPITGVSIDTRSLKAGDLFVAFLGTQVDGHDFIPKAISRGASAVMASTHWAGCEQWDAPIPLIMAEDPEKSLADLATAHRKLFEIPVIAITGTNGKTSTKNILSHILSRRGSVLATQGNYNNHIGLPLTLLNLDESHDVAVLEMGASRSGDIAYLCKIAQPTQGLITNIGLAHTEYFHDVETIQKTKSELFKYLHAHYGRAYVNLDDARIRTMSAMCPNPITFGLSDDKEHAFRLEGPNSMGCFGISVDGKAIQLKVPGKAVALNAIAAATVALQNGILYTQLIEALESYSGEPGRMQVERVGDVQFFNDAYNANPASVQVGLETIAAVACGGRKIIVFGDMLELGAQSRDLHKEAANQMLDAGLDYVLLYGHEVQACVEVLESRNFTSFTHFTTKDEAHLHLLSIVRPGDLIYLKGSRGMALETFLQAYKEKR